MPSRRSARCRRRGGEDGFDGVKDDVEGCGAAASVVVAGDEADEREVTIDGCWVWMMLMVMMMMEKS